MTPSASHLLRWTARAALAGVAGLAAGLLLAAGAPVLFGYHSFTVMSGSMEPAIATGDVVVDRPIPPLEARVGDVVTFSDPHTSGRLITHRLRRVQARGRTAQMVTKGDANNTVERWTVAADGRIGRVAFRVPKLGYALALTRTCYSQLLLVALPALLLGAYELVRIWRPRRDEVHGGVAG